MDSHLTEESLWASGLAARLRLIQATCADDPPATRQGYIAEEIERAMKDVVMSKKQVYLAALGERFPAWQAPEPAPVEPSSAPAAAPETPEALLGRLLQMVPSLSPEVKEDFARKLQQAGLATKQSVDFALDIPPEYQKKLGLPQGKTINPERTIKLLAALFDMTVAMDQLVWALWKQIAPQSNIRKEGDFAKLAGPYLVGDTEVSTQQLVQILERTRKLNASLLGATGRGSSNFAKKHVGQFAPEVIEDLAKIERGFAQSLESVSWKKYVQLAKEYASEPVIENEIQKAIAKAAERLMMGGAVT
jgi:hypothetical protein